MTADELREYNRIKQRESRQRRGIGKKQPVPVPVVPAPHRAPVFSQPKSGGAQFHCSVKLDAEEITKQLSGPQIHALMYGIAQVLAVV